MNEERMSSAGQLKQGELKREPVVGRIDNYDPNDPWDDDIIQATWAVFFVAPYRAAKWCFSRLKALIGKGVLPMTEEASPKGDSEQTSSTPPNEPSGLRKYIHIDPVFDIPAGVALTVYLVSMATSSGATAVTTISSLSFLALVGASFVKRLWGLWTGKEAVPPLRHRERHPKGSPKGGQFKRTKEKPAPKRSPQGGHHSRSRHR